MFLFFDRSCLDHVDGNLSNLENTPALNHVCDWTYQQKNLLTWKKSTFDRWSFWIACSILSSMRPKHWCPRCLLPGAAAKKAFSYTILHSISMMKQQQDSPILSCTSNKNTSQSTSHCQQKAQHGPIPRTGPYYIKQAKDDPKTISRRKKNERAWPNTFSHYAPRLPSNLKQPKHVPALRRPSKQTLKQQRFTNSTLSYNTTKENVFPNATSNQKTEKPLRTRKKRNMSRISSYSRPL